MARVGKPTLSAKQTAAAARSELIANEQRRLKAAAADRRAAAATAPDEKPNAGFVTRHQGPPTTARPSKYLQ